jgi:hypothetical protein
MEKRILENLEIREVRHRLHRHHSLLLRILGQGVMFVGGRGRRRGRESKWIHRILVLLDRVIVWNRYLNR